MNKQRFSLAAIIAIPVLSIYTMQNGFGQKNATILSFHNPTTWSNPQIFDILTHAKIISIEPIQYFLGKRGKTKIMATGQVSVVTLEGGIRAIFKRRSFPLEDDSDSYAEAAAYQISQWLGFPYVPPTIVRKIDGNIGALQLFVEDYDDLSEQVDYDKAISAADPDDLANLRLFYFVFGQWDSGRHNLFGYRENGRTYLVPIDNAGICNKQRVVYGQLPYINIIHSDQLGSQDFGQPFPFDRFQIMEDASPQHFWKIFNDRLPSMFYNCFHYSNQTIRYVIYNNAIWHQYFAFQDDFPKSWTDRCPTKTIEKLKKLDLFELRKMFKVAEGAKFLSTTYLEDILERRDQIVKFCVSKTSF